MSKHTPGPWELRTWDEDCWRVLGTNGVGIPGCYSIADVINGNGSEQNKANAALIAAAPDLLQALQLLHDDIAEYARINNLGGFDNHAMKLARAAIAKATGEQP